MNKVTIPLYLICSVIRHVERVVSHASTLPNDTKTKEAIRMLRKELARIKKIKEVSMNEDT